MPKKTPTPDLLTSLRILNQIGASILSELTVEQIVNQVYHHVNELMDAYSFAIGIYNPSTRQIEYTGSRENDKILPFFSIDAHNSERFSGWVFENKKSILINDFEKEVQHYLPKPLRQCRALNRRR